MPVLTIEGVVEGGQIRLKTDLRLPDNMKVYVVAPDIQVERTARIVSPRLTHREDAKDFKLDVVEGTS